MLRFARMAAAAAVFAAVTFFFLDFAQILPPSVSLPTRWQLIPALLSGSAAVVAALFVAAILFGRIYCSVLCPLGILQDILRRFGLLFRSKKRKNFFWPAQSRCRIFFFAAACVCALISGGWLGLFDPYANFGRIAVTLFGSIWRFGNNLLVDRLIPADSGTLYRVAIHFPNGAVTAFSVGMLLLVGYLSIRFGRLYCNAVCPVGTLLGWLSRFAVWKIRMDTSKCVSCGRCASRCKSNCINARDKTIEASRCVVCFDCLSGCPTKAISWRPPCRLPIEPSTEERKTTGGDEGKMDSSKRLFLSTLLGLSASVLAVRPSRTLGAAEVPEIFYTGYVAYRRKTAISPPGSRSHEQFERLCVSCHLCVAKCPSHALKPALGEYGLRGIFQPTLSFEHGFCNYDCHDCGQVCPTGAIRPLTLAEKHAAQVGRVEFIRENCVVVTDGTSCGACAEHCPTQAVHMVAYRGALTIPEINPELCVGCGACESICPVRPFRAVHVEGCARHGQALPPPETEKEEVQIDGFGF